MDLASGAAASLAFGRFRVLPHRRELLADGRPIRLGGRAFDVLMALIDARGAVVGKHALMARVWPDRVVEENNLQAHIVTLRKAFGAERELIRTVSGRGYQFTGEIHILSSGPDERAGAAAAEPATAASARRGSPSHSHASCCRTLPTGSGSPSWRRSPIPPSFPSPLLPWWG